MKSTLCTSRFVILAAISILFTGCLFKKTTVPVRHFVLASIPVSERASADGDPVSVGISSVKMPSYLLRNSMVLRKSPHEIEYLEDSLWSERLDQSFQRTLAANLSILLPSDRVYLSAWEPDQVEVTVFVNVEQFDVDAQGRGELVANWRIAGAENDRPLKQGEARLARSGASPRGNPVIITTTLSELTADFGRELAKSVHEATRSKP
jgi:uncharacterized lipoprotein YmbA